MKLKMKKWIMRPLTLSLAIILTVMTPFTSYADEEGTEAEVQTAEAVLSGYTLTLPKDTYTFTGSAIKPEVSLVSEETTEETPAYSIDSVVYKNNTAVGTASVTATVSVEGCKGTATKKASFTIVPKKATGVKETGFTTSSISAACDAMPKSVLSGSSAKRIYRFELMTYSSASSAWKTLKTVESETNKATFKSLYSAKAYRVQVTYVVKNGKTSYKGKSSVKTACPTSPLKVKNVSAVKTGAKSMKVTWKKATRASGYVVEYSKTSSFKNVKKVTVKDGSKTSYTIKKLDSNKCYYVRVYAYRTYDGVTVNGARSAAAFSKPEKASKPAYVSRTTNSVTVKCAASKTSSCVYRFRLMKYSTDKKKWVTAKTVVQKSNKITFKNLNSGRRYKVKVSYGKKTASGKSYIYGAWSALKEVVTTPAQVTLNNVTKSSSKKMKLSWDRLSYGSGYQIQYAANSKLKNAKKVTFSGISKKSKRISVSANKTYYARIRAYVTINGKKVYGAWSAKQGTYYSCVYASYTTTYSSSNYNRTCNLKRACSEIDGTILQPGETFSFNNVVGPRTAARGYKSAIVYSGGQEVYGIGGGICQVATTLFNAALRANFTIVERHQHSMTVHYAPLGYDAAIAGTAKTLRFTNNSGVPILIRATAEGGSMTMKFLANTYKKPPTVSTRVTVSNRVYTLRRYVNGKCNYTTTSCYSDI